MARYATAKELRRAGIWPFDDEGRPLRIPYDQYEDAAMDAAEEMAEDAKRG